MNELGLYHKVKDFMMLDISNLKAIDDNSFDVAVCIGGPLNYLFDKEKVAVREMLRKLKHHGRLILGVMSKIGSLIYFMNGIICEKEQFGIEATKWLFSTGMQDKEHHPVKNEHYVHMMTSKELDELFADERVNILEKSSARLNLYCCPLEHFSLKLE